MNERDLPRRRPVFASSGARQATKRDLLDILVAINPDIDSADRNEARWTVDSLRAALIFAIEQETARTARLRADAADFERRWLAECRAHGETRSKLETAEGLLPLARPFGPDGPCCPYHRSGGPHTIACGDDRYNGHSPFPR